MNEPLCVVCGEPIPVNTAAIWSVQPDGLKGCHLGCEGGLTPESWKGAER